MASHTCIPVVIKLTKSFCLFVQCQKYVYECILWILIIIIANMYNYKAPSKKQTMQYICMQIIQNAPIKDDWEWDDQFTWNGRTVLYSPPSSMKNVKVLDSMTHTPLCTTPVPKESKTQLWLAETTEKHKDPSAQVCFQTQSLKRWSVKGFA